MNIKQMQRALREAEVTPTQLALIIADLLDGGCYPKAIQERVGCTKERSEEIATIGSVILNALHT